MGKQTYIPLLIKKTAKEKTPGPVQSIARTAKAPSSGTVQTRHNKRIPNGPTGSLAPMIEDDDDG